jgi:hypothetical protein
MDPERKRAFFELMVAIGYKEIEVGYPSASQTDFDFVRLLAESDLVPPDVTIVVFTPARRDLIERTVESVAGMAGQVVIHMYAATAPVWRDVVLRRTRDELAAMIYAGAEDILELAGDSVRFQFSPEVFNLTEPDFVLELADQLTKRWDATPERPVILNLPATIEAATPNVYADQIEYMHKNLPRREGVILSVHPHNDRGTGIACAELAVLAGAQRVEGCIFGNGERTGSTARGCRSIHGIRTSESSSTRRSPGRIRTRSGRVSPYRDPGPGRCRTCRSIRPMSGVGTRRWSASTASRVKVGSRTYWSLCTASHCRPTRNGRSPSTYSGTRTGPGGKRVRRS